MSVVIEVEEISKKYRLGSVGYSSLKDDLSKAFHFISRKKLDEKNISVNDRTLFSNSDFIWSLKDISFSVEQGDVLGIVGKNGAGKSTLLKILSRVTAPTAGQIKIRGRIASLLEVGTGFHPELTGRENIYLNGAILGMRKHEIQSKYDEIVAFAGVERYIDTPVKRYSSGMYVRLAFAVAAHLEPEILIVDEVLAVGDAEFQRKCLGKMKDVSEHGRTILFVSHNMAAIKSLCNKGVFLENGLLSYSGKINETISRYSGINNTELRSFHWTEQEGTIVAGIRLIEVRLYVPRKEGNVTFDMRDSIVIEATLDQQLTEDRIDITYHLKSETGEKLFSFSSSCQESMSHGKAIRYICKIPSNFFNAGSFSIDLFVVKNKREALYVQPDILNFTIQNKPIKLGEFMGDEPGFLHPHFDWAIA
jgi:lipopolysaccharide transport system ATP-binding protein